MPEFFSKSDRNQRGEIASEYPAWMHERHLEELGEEIESIKRRLDRGEVTPNDIPELREQLSKRDERFKEISRSKPKLTGKDKDDVASVMGDLGEKIKDSMFYRTDMNKGTASAHEEAKRMSEPCIPLDAKGKELAESLGVVVHKKGMVTRNDAQRIYKIAAASLDDDTDVEKLRRDRNSVEVK